jgi:hypothetical protein
VNQNGQAITGYYIVLRTSAGKSLATGYTTKTFTGLTTGTSYEVELDSYGSCTFEHWQGTTNSGDLAFTASGPQTFVGVFDCSGAAAPAAAKSAPAIQPLPLAAFSVMMGSTLIAGKITRVKRD